jgi:streptomycin 6-kinase
MKELWRPAPPGPFPTVADWGRAFARHREAHGGGSGPLPEVLFDRAEALYHRLDASTRERVLLHGDLHQGNILAAQRRPWLAIDPKGLVGDPLYEVWPILNNLWEEFYEVPDPAEVLKGRVTLLAGALDADPERVRGWGIAGCVLSAIWSAEDGGTEWGPAIAHAEILAADGS